MADSLATDQLLSIVLLRPGWEEEYDGTPEIESVACLGRIIWHEKLPDGRYNLRLQGLARIALVEEIAVDRHYRVARSELIGDIASDDLARLTELRRELAEAVLPRFAPEGPARQQLVDLFEGEMPLGHVCDVLSYALPLPLEIKQSLLAEARAELRAEMIVQAIRISASRADRKFPPEFSAN